MTEHIQGILKRTEGKKVGIFVDEANLFYSQKTLGWRIDWRRTMMFFERYCSVSMSRYYMGMPPPPGVAYEKNVITKARLDKIGFSVVTKPLKKIFTNFFEDIKDDVQYIKNPEKNSG